MAWTLWTRRLFSIWHPLLPHVLATGCFRRRAAAISRAQTEHRLSCVMVSHPRSYDLNGLIRAAKEAFGPISPPPSYKFLTRMIAADRSAA